MLFDVLCHIGGFQSSPTIVYRTLFQMLVVHFTLNVFAITANLARHADCDFVLFQKSCDFGYQGDEFQTGADIALILSELHRQ